MKFELNLHKRNIPKEELVADLQKVASEIGQSTITAAIYGERGKHGTNTMLRRFGSWNKALNAAGLGLNNLKDSNPLLPGTAVGIRTQDKNKNSKIQTNQIFPIDPTTGIVWKFTSEPGILLRASVMVHARPSARHEARQPRRSGH
jgi:hypothetical protein